MLRGSLNTMEASTSQEVTLLFPRSRAVKVYSKVPRFVSLILHHLESDLDTRSFQVGALGDISCLLHRLMLFACDLSSGYLPYDPSLLVESIQIFLSPNKSAWLVPPEP